MNQKRIVKYLLPSTPTQAELNAFIELKCHLAEQKKPITNPFEGEIKRVVVELVDDMGEIK